MLHRKGITRLGYLSELRSARNTKHQINEQFGYALSFKLHAVAVAVAVAEISASSSPRLSSKCRRGRGVVRGDVGSDFIETT